MVNKLKGFLITAMIVIGSVSIASIQLGLASPSAGQVVQKIKIGIIGSMQHMHGIELWNAAQITADSINKDGGIKAGGKNYQIELVKYDSNELFSVDDAASAMLRALIVDKCKFMIGGERSEAVIAMEEVAMDHKTIFMDTASASPTQTDLVKNNYDRYKYYFRSSMMADINTIAYILADLECVAKQVKSALKIATPRVAVVADSASYADSFCKLVPVLFPKMGFELAGIWRTNYTATDLFAEASAIQSKNVHIICTVQSGTGSSALVNAYAKLKIPAVLMGIVTDAQNGKYWESSGGACNFVCTYRALAPVGLSKLTMPFYKEYMKRYGIGPGAIPSASANGNMLALKAAIEAAGSLDSNAVVAALEKVDTETVFGRIKFNPPGSQYPHQGITGPGYRTMVSIQWVKGNIACYFPDGNEFNPELLKLGAISGWNKVKMEGLKKVELPPWMIDFWKKK